MKLHSFTGGLAGTNAWLLETDTALLLFDAPTDTSHWLDELDLRPDAVLLTHQHWDHVQDLGAVVKATGAEVWSWEPVGGESLTLAKRFEENFGMPCPVPDYQIDHVIRDQQEIEVAGETLGLRHVPGHSPDSVCFLVEDHLVCGDTVMAGGVGRTDLPHSEPQRFGAAIADGILSLPDDTVLLPGHGPATSVDREKSTNPFLRSV